MRHAPRLAIVTMRTAVLTVSLFASVAVTTLAAQGVGLGDRFELPAERNRSRRIFLELRLAETEPVRGLTIEGTVKESGRKTYVHNTVLAANGDVQKATIAEKGGRYAIVLTMTREGAEKMADATTRHKGRPLAVILDGEITSLVSVRTTLREQVMILEGLTMEEAARISSSIVW